MKQKWYKYLSKQNDPKLIPIMEEFFNGDINFEELNDKIELEFENISTFKIFEKSEKINEILGLRN